MDRKEAEIKIIRMITNTLSPEEIRELNLWIKVSKEVPRDYPLFAPFNVEKSD